MLGSALQMWDMELTHPEETGRAAAFCNQSGCLLGAFPLGCSGQAQLGQHRDYTAHHAWEVFGIPKENE